MPDIIDVASELQDEHFARSIARLDLSIPAGAPGECEQCLEPRPRLVGGRCGYCRDGRQPPEARLLAPPPPAPRPKAPPIAPAPPPPSKEIATMPNPKPSDDFRNISILAKGPVLAAISELAARDNLSLGKAAATLVIRGIQAPPTVAIATEPAAALADLKAAVASDNSQIVAAPAPALNDLATVSLADLLDEVRARVEQATALQEAEARAIAAEQRLRAVTELLAGSPA